MPGGVKRKRDEVGNLAGAGVAVGIAVGATEGAGVVGVGKVPVADAHGKEVAAPGQKEASLMKSSLTPRGMNLVRKIVSKACSKPTEEKYRRINSQSRVLQEALGQSAEAILGLLGFAKKEEDAVWYLPEEKCSLLGDRLRDIEMHFEIVELGVQKRRGTQWISRSIFCPADLAVPIVIIGASNKLQI